MTVDDDCPFKSNSQLATLADLEAALGELPVVDDAGSSTAASFASDVSSADIAEITRFDSPALKAAEAEQEQRLEKIAAESAKRARDDYAIEKRARTGEDPRSYKPTGIAPRHKANGHFQFEFEDEHKRRYDRELKQSKRPKFVPLTDEEKKERKKASNAKRKAR